MVMHREAAQRPNRVTKGSDMRVLPHAGLACVPVVCGSPRTKAASNSWSAIGAERRRPACYGCGDRCVVLGLRSMMNAVSYARQEYVSQPREHRVRVCLTQQ